MTETADVRTLDREALRRKMEEDEDLVVVEVLSRESYEAGHIPGARHLPPQAIREKAPELFPDRATPIVTYCSNRDCAASTRAYRILRDMGYENVWEYPGSKRDWTQAGLPLERGGPAGT